MRRWISVTALAAVALAPATAAAQDAEALRKELEQMKKQFESMKDSYEKSINNLSERLQKIESAPAPTAVAPPPTAPAVSQVAPGAPAGPPPSGGLPSLMELARPRQPFALYERRGPGQFLFDIGVAGDFIGNLTQHNVEQAQGGTFPGLENYFFPEGGRALAVWPDRSVCPGRGHLRGGAGVARRRAEREPGRGQPDPHDAPVQHPGEAGQDAQPVTVS